MADQKQNQEKKTLTDIAAVEAVIDKYLDENIVPIFDRKAAELEKKQKDESYKIHKAWADTGLPNSALYAAGDLSKHGKQQSLGFDWVIDETRKELNNPKYRKIREDMTNLYEAYAKAIVSYTGEEKYNVLCKKYDKEIVREKFEDMFLNKMEALLVKRKMPKSDMEYVLQTVKDNSLFGYATSLLSPKQSEKDENIANKAYESYDASLSTKVTGHGISLLLDTAMLGGRNPLTFAKVDGGIRLLCAGVKAVYRSFNEEKTTIGKIDKDIYGVENSKAAINKEKLSADSVAAQKNFNLELNNNVRLKYSPSAAKSMQRNLESNSSPQKILTAIYQSGIKVQSMDIPAHIKEKDVKENYRLACYFAANLVEMRRTNTKSVKFGDTTLTQQQVAQRARDYAYYANEQIEMAKAKELEEQSKNEIADFVTDPDGEVRMVTYARDSKRGQELAAANNPQAMVNEQMQNGFGGWQSMLGWGGGEFLSSTKNLNEIISSLPDMLVGMFTGRNKHLKLSECFFPIAAIMGAMFFKNPLLKLLMLFAGFMMITQKANKKIEEGNAMESSRTYKRVADEPLNPRIKNPVMKGNTLVASIDDRPYVITVSDQAVDAYYKGYVPINALSNKVLEVFDRQEGELQSAYSQNVANTEEQQRTRGIK